MAQAIVYSSTNCGFCKQLKSYLDEQNISYEERNIDENEAYREELSRLGMMSVPLTLIGEKQILGFNPNRIKKALAALETAEQ
ncbi:glutaredoxin family protein [Brevibacillus ruminantium]|uniref:Glutaredoxin family protein n=1 Tax=Brevibacillus ruminantium TaxID=2950604 RepID=A0ABY4WBP2_9BACL|nr:glutaredoxin family protein [Brevibacillus ruminantium]USG64462.1 glutaredoxin family protein [Brevibacillus ruminantium]